ncbi:LytR/AlgR family response regulator transcription factor [Flectobacillus rivi]|uniref:LytTR family DNA-binding domain-containing protein n=1 Tax=Flectobacillus rivi TaxID=2984209 RepID=A0ABT6YWT3_9BACT|nr:LytTR family DNA-binding domain-containing protein [Flectobacillus rivi]MDI9873348.1 LytTR family DNA-binding domain-containing protein [Flectobacillus rivi]
MTKNCYPYLLDPCPPEFKDRPRYDVTIPFENIIYIQANINYSIIKQIERPPEIFSITLKELLPRLVAKSNQFIRVHKAFIINLKFVVSYNKTSLMLSDGTIVPIAKRRWKEVAQRLL